MSRAQLGAWKEKGEVRGWGSAGGSRSWSTALGQPGLAWHGTAWLWQGGAGQAEHWEGPGRGCAGAEAAACSGKPWLPLWPFPPFCAHLPAPYLV